MKTFHFGLQKILDIKEKEREQAEWAYGQSVQRQQLEEARLAELNRRREEVDRSLFSVQTGTFHAAMLREVAYYQQAYDRAIHVQKQRLFGCAQEVERCQERLKATVQESKLWHRLKEHARDEFEQTAKMAEQKELDELAVTRYVHRFSRA